MKRVSLRAISVSLGVLFLASCNGSSGGSGFIGNLPGPPVQPSFSRLFDGQSTSGLISIIAPPFAAPLTPAASFSAAGGSRFLAFNAPNGMLAATTFVPSVIIYNSPYSSSTTPAVTISGGTSTLTGPEGVAWDGTGNLWVADFGGSFKEFSPPFTATSAPVVSNAPGGNPTGLAINPSAGLLFVASVNGGGNAVRVYPAPYTGTPTATLAASSAWAVAVDLLGRLFVSNSGTGTISVFTPPFATGNAPAFTLSSGSGVVGMAFDSAQNLYVQHQNGSVDVYNGPILGTLAAPSTLLGCPSGVCNTWGGVAFGP